MAMYDVQGTHFVPGMTPEQERAAARWETPAIVAALLVIPYLVLNHEEPDSALVDALSFVIWGFFIVEAVAILRLSPSFFAWLRRNTLDLAVIVVATPLPFLPDGFEVFQVLWLARILDLLPIVHQRVMRVTVLRFALILWAIIVLAGGFAFVELEEAQDPSLFEAMYWANTTVSTVGYGDFSPSTVEGQVMTIILQVSGPIIAAILVAGIIPLFDRAFAEGFSRHVGEAIEQLRGDVDELEEEALENIAVDAEQTELLGALDRRLAKIDSRLASLERRT